jgi:hypothetical protein
VLTELLNYPLGNPDDLGAITGEVRTALSSEDNITGSSWKPLLALSAASVYSVLKTPDTVHAYGGVAH